MIADVRYHAPAPLQLAAVVGILAIAYILVTVFILPVLSHQGKYWSTQPWVGVREQWFGRYRAGLRALQDTQSMVLDGYERFSRNSKAFVLPQFINKPLLVLPGNKLSELLSLPDASVDAHIQNNDGIALDYTVGKDVADGPHIDIVRRQLTRRLPQITNDVYEELVLSMEDQWNANAKAGEWTTVKAYDSCQKIVSRAANRVFAGAELCRNEEFLEHTRLYAIAGFTAGAILRLFPKALQPIVAPPFQWKINKHLNVCKRISLPIIRERIQKIRNPPKDPSHQKPEDCLQWMLEDIVEIAKSNPAELDETLNVRRLLLLNMVAIHTTSISMTNTLLDLYTSPHKEEYLTGLREEVEQAVSVGSWSKSAINSMYRVDSTIRESMRYSTLADVQIRRTIVNPSGITLSGGLHIPYNTYVAAPSHPIHREPAFYGETANEWDAFRFSRPREAYEEGKKSELSKVLEQKNQALTATGTDFLSFGHGRHSCPGRFFASQEMKLMLAHIVMKYDIEVVGGVRPPNMHMNGASVPSQTAELRVRLRS